MNDPLKETAEKLWGDWKEREIRRQAEHLARLRAQYTEDDRNTRRGNIAITALAVGYLALVLVLVRFLTR